MRPNSKACLTAVEIGALAGMRTASPPAWLAHGHHSKGVRIFQGFALLEIVGDKLPSTPSRISTVQLAARVVSGAVSSLVWIKRGEVTVSRWVLAGLGGASAATVTYLAYYLRRGLGQRTGIRDSLLGIAEDAAASKLGTVIAAAA